MGELRFFRRGSPLRYLRTISDKTLVEMQQSLHRSASSQKENTMGNAWRDLVPELPVADMERALDYYQGPLGFTLQWVYEEQGFAAVMRDGVRLFLRRQDPPFEEVVCNFYVDNVDVLYETLAAGGARVLSVPEDKPWGTREFAFEDPDENLFRVHRLLVKEDAEAR